MNDLEAGKLLSDPDPIRRAQIQMRTPLPKRFYKEVAVAAGEGGFVVHLDGKPVKTPGKALLVLPTERAARLVADEFAAQGETLDLGSMPAYRLVNTAIDGVASDPQAVLEDILRFSSSDLLCYRADAPDTLVRRQNEAWDPVIDWARATLGARLLLAEGVIHVEQPREAIAAIGVHLSQRAEPLRLAALACDDQPDGLGAAWRWPSISASSTPKPPGTPPMSTRTSRPSTGARIPRRWRGAPTASAT